jgi:hypothetical protein
LKKFYALLKNGAQPMSSPIGVVATGPQAGSLLQVRPTCPHEKYGDPDFRRLLDEAWALHCAKAADYGSDTDPLANLKRCERVGVRPITGLIIRLEDKFHRVERWHQKGALANESIEDTFKDIAGYCNLGILLLRQEEEAKEPEPKQSER